MSRAAEVGSTANSYQILAKLAAGGMAEIFLARGEGVAGVERYCVLKRILHERASDVHFVRMFLDEARLAAQLQHPNIAQVHDIGKLGDSYFFTMEYVHGETVRALLHRAQGLRRKLPIACVLTIAAGTAAGLHHAHTRLGVDGRALGIVHRDVSPSNLMVSYEGGVKVVDFGVAKAADRGHETKSGTVKGKISYLSPEQCKGKRVDRRSDLFSLGICLWEMLTTERLYRRASDFENMNAIVTEPTPLPSSRRDDVPREVDELVLRLLAKTPEERFQTADEVVEAIEEVATRTSCTLSTSALSKLVREMFGQRPEPWLELEGQHEQAEPVTVTSEPIPRELAVPAADKIKQQLASVVDLSPPSATESIESMPADVSTTRIGRRAATGFPLIEPPPTLPGVTPAAHASKSDPALPPLAARPSGMTGHSRTISLPENDPFKAPARSTAAPVEPAAAARPARSNGTSRMAAPLPPPPAPPSVPEMPSGLPAIAAPPAVPPPSTPVARRLPLAAPPLAEPSPPPSSASSSARLPASSSSTSLPAAASTGFNAVGPRLTPSGPFIAPAGPQESMRASASHRAAARRRAWPLYAVIAGAALVGSIAVIVMTSSRTGMASDAPSARAADPVAKMTDPSPMVRAAPTITVDPIEPSAPEADDPKAAPSNGAPPNTMPGADASGASARHKAQTDKLAAGHTAPSPRPTAPPASKLHDGATDSLMRLYSAGSYDKVIEQCGAGPIPAEHAPICFLAACHAGNDDKARKLLSAVPVARRDQLIANCQQFGVDLRKSTKPAEDCEADPMACQH